MDTAVIVSAVRTPIGKLKGSLSSLTAAELGAVVVRASLDRANVPPEDVDEVIVGQVFVGGSGMCPARQAAVAAGIPYTVPAYNVSMVCGSGMRAVISASSDIQTGNSKIVVAVGQESMSNVPHVAYIRNGVSFGSIELEDMMLKDGLTDPFHSCHMGITAENVAKQWNISREDQDDYALQSQLKAESALENGWMVAEITPVSVTDKKGNVTINSKDEHPRYGSNIASMRKLKPCFLSTGTVTPGNSSGLNDGAASLLLMSEKEALKRGIAPLGRVVAWAQVGVDPTIMGTGPIAAVNTALKKAGWSLGEVDLFEVNEAFAAASIAVLGDLGVDGAKVNVCGGAIALGHPLGATGVRVIVTLLHSLTRTGGTKGIAALCIGSGMGIALCVQANI